MDELLAIVSQRKDEQILLAHDLGDAQARRHRLRRVLGFADRNCVTMVGSVSYYRSAMQGII